LHLNVHVSGKIYAATERFERVDIVVDSAGIIQVGPMSMIAVEDCATALDVMF
jgi:NADP-dependent 3-hydroxy acid dehydrogenase YdfG